MSSDIRHLAVGCLIVTLLVVAGVLWWRSGDEWVENGREMTWVERSVSRIDPGWRPADGADEYLLPPVRTETVRLALPVEWHRFDQWLKRYSTASEAQRERMVAEGLLLAEARRNVMKELIKQDPERALDVALTPAERALLPDSFDKYIEQEISGEGFYGVAALCNHAEGESHNASCKISREVVLRWGTFEAEVYAASVYGSRLGRLTEEQASLYGVALDGQVALNEGDVKIYPAEQVTGDPGQAGQWAVIYKGKTNVVADPQIAIRNLSTRVAP
jgi:hypothetical protein